MSIVNKHKAPSDIQTPPSGYTTLFIRSDTEVPALKDSDGNVSDLVIPGDASGVTYTPSEPLNWTDSVDPGNVDAALDDLALRVVTLESADLGGGGSGTIGGSTGSTDNAVQRADGTGGSTVQSSGVIIDDNNALYGQYAKVETQTGTTYTFVAADTGKIIRFSNASPITVTLPNSLLEGWNVLAVQAGAGQVTYTAASGATLTNRSGHTKAAGQYAQTPLFVSGNSGGTSAIYNLGGDTTS